MSVLHTAQVGLGMGAVAWFCFWYPEWRKRQQAARLCARWTPIACALGGTVENSASGPEMRLPCGQHTLRVDSFTESDSDGGATVTFTRFQAAFASRSRISLRLEPRTPGARLEVAVSRAAGTLWDAVIGASAAPRPCEVRLGHGEFDRKWLLICDRPDTAREIFPALADALAHAGMARWEFDSTSERAHFTITIEGLLTTPSAVGEVVALADWFAWECARHGVIASEVLS